MKQINEVFETHDYGQFRFIKGNRLIRASHVNNILKSMKKRRLFSPLIVNEKMEIIDGQHRFKAQEKLNKSIEVIVEKDEQLIGGATIRVGDHMIDGSVRSQLSNLNRFLIN